jgi:UDP-glucose 4-epimerase
MMLSSVIATYFPEAIEVYERNHWTLPERIDQVYPSDKALRMLNYKPKLTFQYLLKDHKEH